METLGGLRSDDQTREYLEQNLAHWDRHGYGLWLLREAQSGAFVGRSAIRHLSVGGNDEVEIGYALMPEYWGRGLATEVSRKMVRIAFDQLRLHGKLVAVTLPNNVASRRVIEKADGVFERNIVHADLPHALFRFRNAHATPEVLSAANSR
jgi:RimJ/RimL family protein N-acetyltransferase